MVSDFAGIEPAENMRAMGVPGESSVFGVPPPCLVKDLNEEAEKFFRSPTKTGLDFAGELDPKDGSPLSVPLEAGLGDWLVGGLIEPGIPLIGATVVSSGSSVNSIAKVADLGASGTWFGGARGDSSNAECVLGPVEAEDNFTAVLIVSSLTF